MADENDKYESLDEFVKDLKFYGAKQMYEDGVDPDDLLGDDPATRKVRDAYSRLTDAMDDVDYAVILIRRTLEELEEEK